MVLSKRERYIALATVIAVAILALDRLVLTPLQERRAAVQGEEQRVLADLERARVLFARKKRLWPKWQEMLDAGLKSGPEEAVSRVLHAVRNWSQEAGFTLSSLRPERATPKGELQEIIFQASGTGPMRGVARFLWRLESSSLPIRITDLQLGTRKEGTDDLSLQLRISALCLPPPRAKDPRGLLPVGPEGASHKRPLGSFFAVATRNEGRDHD